MRSALFFLIALILFANAEENQWLYTADSYGLSYNLYVTETLLTRCHLVGQIKNAEGDKFTINAMHYLNDTGLIYAVGNERASNVAKTGGILAIDPTNAQVVWYNDCRSSNFGRLFNSMAYDSLREQFIFTVVDIDGRDDRNITFLSRADMIAGNCQNMALRWPSPSYPFRNDVPSGAHYLPQYDALVTGSTAVGLGTTFYFFNMSVDPATSADIRSVSQTTAAHSGYNFSAGDYTTTPDGVVWQLATGSGPANGVLMNVDFRYGVAFDLILGGFVTIDVTYGGDRVIPRGLGGLTVGPPRTQFNPWVTPFSGAVLMLTQSNILIQVNANVPAPLGGNRWIGGQMDIIMTAIESLGTWDQVYGIVANASGPNGFLVHISIPSGELTTVAELPVYYTSLTRSSDGRLVAFRYLDETRGEAVILDPISGQVGAPVEIACPPSVCRRVLLDGSALGLVNEREVVWVSFPNTSEPSPRSSFLAVDGCPESYPTENCTGWWSVPGFGSVGDWSSAGPGAAIINVRHEYSTRGMTSSSIFHMNLTTGRADIIADVPSVLFSGDIAYYQYNRAYCSNNGDWVGYRCVCDSNDIDGERCENAPPPINPPAGPPTSAPPSSLGSSPSLPSGSSPSGSSPSSSQAGPSGTSAAPSAGAKAAPTRVSEAKVSLNLFSAVISTIGATCCIFLV